MRKYAKKEGGKSLKKGVDGISARIGWYCHETIADSSRNIGEKRNKAKNTDAGKYFHTKKGN